MNSDSLNMVSRLGEGHMPGTFFLSEPQLKTTVHCVVKYSRPPDLNSSSNVSFPFAWNTGPGKDPSLGRSKDTWIQNVQFSILDDQVT